MFPAKGQMVNNWGFSGFTVSVTISSALGVQKQPDTIGRCLGVAVFQ